MVTFTFAAAHAQDMGQERPSNPISLEQAYAHALENEATLRAMRAQADGVNERVEQARAQLRPRVSFNASRFHNDLDRTQPNILGQTTTTQEKYYSSSQNLLVRQPLYRPALGWGVDVALAQKADAQALLAREIQNLGVKVLEAYLQVLLAQEQETLLRQQVQFAAQQLQSAQKRLVGGQGIRTDIDEAQARIDLLAAQQLQARQSRQTALLQLQSMTQQPVESVYSLDAEALDINSFPAQTPAFWMDKAEASSPELQAMRARLESARLDVQRAQASHQPTLDALLQISRSVSENVTSPRSASTNRQIGLQLDMPLYAGGAVQSAVRQALAEQTRLEETMEAARRDLNVRVQREWRGVTESGLRTKALMRAVASADQVVVSVKRSFEAGFRTVLDVLNAEQQAHQARRDLGEARLTHVAARMRLLALAGELDAQQIQWASRWFRP
jgi:outer membrane protein/protease secretion system outer membrane protein